MANAPFGWQRSTSATGARGSAANTKSVAAVLPPTAWSIEAAGGQSIMTSLCARVSRGCFGHISDPRRDNTVTVSSRGGCGGGARPVWAMTGRSHAGHPAGHTLQTFAGQFTTIATPADGRDTERWKGALLIFYLCHFHRRRTVKVMPFVGLLGDHANFQVLTKILPSLQRSICVTL